MYLKTVLVAMILVANLDPPTTSPPSGIQIPEQTLQSLNSIIQQAADLQLCTGGNQCSLQCKIERKSDGGNATLLMSVAGPYVRLQGADEEFVFSFNANAPDTILAANAKDTSDVKPATANMLPLFILEVSFAERCISIAASQRESPRPAFGPNSI
jgi:hypothetical protein